jgi:hypothetical protein
VLCFIDSAAAVDVTETEASTQISPDQTESKTGLGEEVMEPIDVQANEAPDTMEDNALRTEL